MVETSFSNLQLYLFKLQILRHLMLYLRHKVPQRHNPLVALTLTAHGYGTVCGFFLTYYQHVWYALQLCVAYLLAICG
jgi:hypothetical protein